MTCAAEALIDLSALNSNLQRVRLTAPTSRIMAVIKANAYGHGLLRVAKALKLADVFAVATLDEAITLRDADITQPILLLEGFCEPEELNTICHYSLSIVVHHSFQIDCLENTALPKPVDVWCMVDTGMHRLGFNPDGVTEALARLNCCSNVVNIRLMTHMANADDRNDALTMQQIDCFNSTVKEVEAEKSIANSATLIARPQSHADWVRPGIMLYGASPFIDSVAEQEELKPVMTLTAKIIAINHHRQGDGIGYGQEWVCPEDMPVGVVAIGYGDGYPRSVKADTPVLINNKRASIVGRVSMDMICLDLRGHVHSTVGDVVTLWGKGLPVEEIARCASTIPYELLCGITHRVKFIEV